ncbi:MAG: hypothetical protein IPM53_10155 [Anaerolineaceae bacterium]|nr:hypothetical protein [Anaerolineaceae bacterium]
MSKRNDILETCLARLAAGDSVENCLADYPAEAEWLRPFLAAASQLNTLPTRHLPPTADQAIQRQLRQAAQHIGAAYQASASPPRQRRLQFMEDGMKNVSRFLTGFLAKWLVRVAVAGTAVALLLIFVTQFTGLIPSLSNPITEPAAETELANITTVGDTTITLEADLSADPGEVPLYRVQTAPVPTTPEEALAWAQNFGLPDPEVFHSANENDPSLYVLGSDGQRLGFQNYPGFSEIFYTNPAASMGSGDPIPFDEATNIAVTFLRAHNLLPDDYQVEPALGSSGSVQRVVVRPRMEAGVIGGDSPGAALNLGISADGQVIHASLGQLIVEPAGTTTVISAQQAYDDLLNGRNVRGSTYSTVTLGSETVRSYQPPRPTWETGQSVDIVGYLDVMINAQTGAERVTLITADQNLYQLTGRRVNEWGGTPGQWGNVHVQGTITGQDNQNIWQLAVDDWEMASPLIGSCLTGSLTETGNVAQFRSEDGINYTLPDAPEEIAVGEQMQVCLSAPAEPGDDLAWINIQVPPPDQGPPPGGVVPEQIAIGEVSGSGGGGGGVVTEQVVVEQAVEVTRVVTATPSEAGGSGMSVEAVPLTDPPTEFIEPTNPYEIGDEVTLTGIVQLYRIVAEDGTERLEATFANDGDQGEATYPLTYPLLANQDLLAEMAEFNSLHIRVYGRIVPATDIDMVFMSNAEQAIEVDSFDRPWPEEKLERFLGHLSLEEVEGQQVLVFTDHATDQQYVINPPNMPAEVHEHDETLQEEQILLTGIVHPVNTFGGLPLLERRGVSSGSDIAQATDVSEIPVIDHDVIPTFNEADMHRREGLGGVVRGDVVIERVELVYVYQPQPAPAGGEVEPQALEPVWAFYGRTANGLEQFIIHVRATTGS